MDAIASGDDDEIAKHAEHLAGCDSCRDARHELGLLGKQLAGAGDDYQLPADLEAKVLARLPVEPKVEAPAPKAVRTRRPMPWATLGTAAALAAGASVYVATRSHSESTGTTTQVATDPSVIGTIAKVDRAAADKSKGLEQRDGSGWKVVGAGAKLAAGTELRTDERTRATIGLADGTQLVLDHGTQLTIAPRKLTLAAGRIVEDVVHIDGQPASVTTPQGTVDIVGTKLAVTATATTTSVQVVRGRVIVSDKNGHKDDVRSGEEGTIDGGTLRVSAVPGIARELEWSEPAQPDAPIAGLGSLKAYKPGETRDRDWNLALANHDVKVRVVGPIARTEITETFRNDSDQVLEGVYQFPLPADAQIDALSLDSKDGFIDGAFVDKQRGQKIFAGVIQHATPHPLEQKPEIIWVPGRWRDPALLDWQRGGRFELKIFPIPAHGARTIKLAYQQVVTPRGPWREYIYPLPHSGDGSTVADKITVDVEIRGAKEVKAVGYDLPADPQRADVHGMTFAQNGFVPRGDLTIDYQPESNAELRAWTFAGGAAAAPDEKLAATKNVGVDQSVVSAQRAIAADLRPTAVIALRPHLPRWKDSMPRDYAIVVDDSQSMTGEKLAKASELATTMIGEMDRRDRVTVYACDSECTTLGEPRTPSAAVATDAKAWLAKQTAAGASDVVSAIRQAAGPRLADRERWVLYIGDGFATTGFRRAGDIEKAIADTSAQTGVRVATVGLGSDADASVLAAAARGGGGNYLAYVPGQRTATTAVAMLDTTYGAALEGATVELPMGLMDVAPSILPTVRDGQEVLIAARVAGDIKGDVVIKGKVAGEPFEQRYPLTLAVSSAAGNGFVPRLWASLAIQQLELAGKGDDRARIVGLSQGYGVMSRETSLLVLESQAMFDAFGIDRSKPTVQWTGEEALDETSAVGMIALDNDAAGGTGTGRSAGKGYGNAGMIATGDAMPQTVSVTPPAPTAKPAPAPPPAKADAPMHHAEAAKKRPAMETPVMPMDRNMVQRSRMIPMRKVWTRVPSVTAYDGVNPAIATAVENFDAALRAKPDSRENHRALVQALSYAGEISRAQDIAQRWLERDRLDPQALGYEADLLGRDGQRDQALRTLAGLVDLTPDSAPLHERMVHAYESVGRMAQACGHRIALANLQTTTAAQAVRCLRSLGRDKDAQLILSAAPDAQRSAIEKAATASPLPPSPTGELRIAATWTGGADLDISLVTPDGTRVSWMGGKSDATVTNATSTEREELLAKAIKRGNYLIEVARGTPSTGVVRGSVDVVVLGLHQTLPFELTGQRVTVGRLSIAMESHLEEAWDYIDQ